LENSLAKLPGVRIGHPREANAVFAHLPRAAVEHLWSRGWRFYDDVDPGGAVRLMCAWDSTEEDVERFVADLAAWIAKAA
jgi:threonine aldolase